MKIVIPEGMGANDKDNNQMVIMDSEAINTNQLPHFIYE